jgi:hypothetical protein
MIYDALGIHDAIGVRTLGSEDMVIAGSVTQNTTPVLEENYVDKMNANNGFSEKRMFRKIARIPIADHLKATQDGYNLDDDKDLYRYLQDHPLCMTVDHILSPRNSQVIVK